MNNSTLTTLEKEINDLLLENIINFKEYADLLNIDIYNINYLLNENSSFYKSDKVKINLNFRVN